MVYHGLLIFDLDDTLIDTSDVYWRARSKFVGLIESLTKLAPDEIVSVFESVDRESLLKLGFSPTRYEHSMLETLSLLCPGRRSGRIRRAVQACGRLVRNDFPKPLPGARELLVWASSHFKLVVVTRGEKSFQLRKIKSVGFGSFFATVIVVKWKEMAIFRSVMQQQGFDEKSSWVIGDSIGADINPGLGAGARCIRYAYTHHSYRWDQDPGVKASGSFVQVNRLTEIIDILKPLVSHGNGSLRAQAD